LNAFTHYGVIPLTDARMREIHPHGNLHIYVRYRIFRDCARQLRGSVAFKRQIEATR
jgi:hypothetical protein